MEHLLVELQVFITGFNLGAYSLIYFIERLKMHLHQLCIAYPGWRRTSLPGVIEMIPFQGFDLLIDLINHTQYINTICT